MELNKFIKKGTDTTNIVVSNEVPVIEFKLLKNIA